MDQICGIDEAGRGCLAGPLVVAGVVLHDNVQGLADSKQLSEKKREALYDQIIGVSTYRIVFTDNEIIDAKGLSYALKSSIEQIVEAIGKENRVIMDGNTTFGVEGIESLIKADSKIKEVSAASILAKVSRDRFMKDMAERFPLYQFEKHKGYGTKLHRDLIHQHGHCAIHRKSFKLKPQQGTLRFSD